MKNNSARIPRGKINSRTVGDGLTNRAWISDISPFIHQLQYENKCRFTSIRTYVSKRAPYGVQIWQKKRKIRIPLHAWELETAEHLLDEWCWIRNLHPDTINRRDYSSFKLIARCFRPELIPASIDLVIVEPPVLVVEDPLVKRGLEYPVEITVSPVVVP